MTTIPELLDWCSEHHGENVYVNRDRDAGTVTLYVSDGTLTVPDATWELFSVLLTVYRPDVTMGPGL